MLDLGGGVKMEFVLVPAGEFAMGSPDNEADRYDDEGPVHQVRITRSFYLGKYEVTQEQWHQVMGNDPSHLKGARNPVEQVTWDDCQAFIRELNRLGKGRFRLPTEAEWEYACRAGTTGACYGELEATAWFDCNSGPITHPVGAKSPNAWGLYDMLGNVWEWCEDTCHDNYHGAPSDGSAWQGGGTARVLRGGSWYYDPRNCRSAYRYWLAPDARYYNVGFRVVVDVE